MSDIRCIDGMRNESIDPTARIQGQSLLAGELTRIGPGAVVRDSYIRNAVVEAGAEVIDTVIIGDAPGWCEAPRSDFEAKWARRPVVVTRIHENARVESSMLTNCVVGARSKISRCSSANTTFGVDARVDNAQCDDSHFESAVFVQGPTEISCSWIGHHARIDEIGCHNATYSNDFYVVEFDHTTGNLSVKDVLDIPHVSRYGRNMISSLHSGFIAPQPGNRFDTFGKAQEGWGRFGNCLWYMGKNRFDPCCWIGSWTKVVGLPCQTVFRSYDELLTLNNSAHVMPFT